LQPILREIAVAVLLAFAAMQIFDLAFPFLVTGVIQDYRTLTFLVAILVAWVLAEAWSGARKDTGDPRPDEGSAQDGEDDDGGDL
jgi:hypothetical protein